MSCYRVKLDKAGAPAAEPSLLHTTEMKGKWTTRAFHQSWDGESVVAYGFKGFRITQGKTTRDVRTRLFYRKVWWSPDNKKLLVWLPRGIVLVNPSDPVEKKEPAPAAKDDSTICKDEDDILKGPVLIPTGGGRPQPLSLTWSPTGSHVYYTESTEKEGVTGTIMKRVSTAGGAPQVVLEHPTELTFWMPPDSWYEDGSGPKAKKFSIVFGAKDGLFVMDGEGQNKTKLADFAPENVRDVIWDPSQKDQFLIYFRMPFQTAAKEDIRGLYVVRLDSLGKKGQRLLEQLTPAVDLHTMYYSRKGKYVGWASNSGVEYVEAAKPGKPTKVVLEGAKGDVKGFFWSDDEEKIAVAVAHKLYSYDFAKKTSAVLATMDEKSFIAEPHWSKDEITFSTFKDTRVK